MQNKETQQKFLDLMKRTGFKPTRTEFEEYSQPSQYVESNCYQIAFVNKGTINARINGFPLAPSESISLPVLDNQYDFSKYKLDFDTGIGTRSVFAIRKLPAEL